MQNTPNYGWPYPESGDHTRTWEYWQNLATAIDSTLFSKIGTRIPIVSVEQTVAQSLPTTATTPLTFDSELLDTANMHSPSTNPSRLIAPSAGLYLLAGSIAFAGNATGRRAVNWAVGGSTQVGNAITLPGSIGATTLQIAAPTTVVALNANEYVELRAYHDVGAALNTVVVANSRSCAIMAKISP